MLRNQCEDVQVGGGLLDPLLERMTVRFSSRRGNCMSLRGVVVVEAAKRSCFELFGERSAIAGARYR